MTITKAALFSAYPQLSMLGIEEIEQILAMPEPDIVKWCISHHREEVSAILVCAHRVLLWKENQLPETVVKAAERLLKRSIDQNMPWVLYKTIFLR